MNPFKKGMILAAAKDYLEQCDRLDEEYEHRSREMLRDAMQALMRGDTAERDRLCDLLRRLPDGVQAAKLEIGLRIGERLGLDRDALMHEIDLVRRTQ